MSKIPRLRHFFSSTLNSERGSRFRSMGAPGRIVEPNRPERREKGWSMGNLESSSTTWVSEMESASHFRPLWTVILVENGPCQSIQASESCVDTNRPHLNWRSGNCHGGNVNV